MTEGDKNPDLTKAPEKRADVKLRTRPASEWCIHVEDCVAKLSFQRMEVRHQIDTQKAERRARNPRG